ncbi:hypothetical protein [Kineococcus rhizosphaerae]|nr:hypothetical protein [Kineococcus rhizosphaerae]
MSDERRDGAWTEAARRRSRCVVAGEGGVTSAATERTEVAA